MTQLQMINKTKSIAQQDENVSAVFMYGSFTKSEGDKYSDIEFYIFLKNKENFSSEKWVNQIHPVALYFTNEYGSEVAIFENMVRGEFHFLKTEEIEIIKSWDGIVAFSDFDQMNLIDKDGHLTKTLNQIKTKHWESPTKSLEKDIDTTWYSAYKTITSDLNPKNIILAFENSLNLSEKLFDELNIEPKMKEILHEIRKNYH